MSDKKDPIVVACAVIHDSLTDSYLLGQRVSHIHNGNFWEFIGGKKEDEDESIQHTLEREVEEEIGIKGKAKEVITKIMHTHANGATLNLQFIIFELPENAKINPDPQVYQQVAWIKREDLMNTDLSHGDKLFAKTLVKPKI